jgi:hypothetical protein
MDTEYEHVLYKEDNMEEDEEDDAEDDDDDVEDDDDDVEDDDEEIYVEPFPINITTDEGKKEYCLGVNSYMLLQMIHNSGAGDKVLIQRVFFCRTHSHSILPPPPSIYHCLSCNAYVNRIHKDINWSICTSCLQMQ